MAGYQLGQDTANNERDKVLTVDANGNAGNGLGQQISNPLFQLVNGGLQAGGEYPTKLYEGNSGGQIRVFEKYLVGGEGIDLTQEYGVEKGMYFLNVIGYGASFFGTWFYSNGLQDISSFRFNASTDFSDSNDWYVYLVASQSRIKIYNYTPYSRYVMIFYAGV